VAATIPSGRTNAAVTPALRSQSVSVPSSRTTTSAAAGAAGAIRTINAPGEGMSAADAWVNVKGNAWQIIGNSGSNAPVDGFQTHRILDGWGAQNVFEANHAVLDGPGFGINITKDDDGNRVACSNTAEGAAKGLTNVTCS
jgi:hypothetical protein